MEVDALTRAVDILRDPAPERRRVVTDLFDREAAVLRTTFEQAFHRRDARCLEALDLIRRAGDRYVPLARIDRVDWLLVASDLRRRRDDADFVVGPGPASFLLAGHVRRPAPGRALDLGCGSGIQSLILAASGAEVDALDINPRAIAFTRFNARLNGLRSIAARIGDFLTDPGDASLAGRFDTVVANPPFVLAPVHRVLYRDRPLPGDQVGERTVRLVGDALAPGGRGYVLCTWIGRDDGPWHRPVRRWMDGSTLDTLVIQVDSSTPAQDAARWNRSVAEERREVAILDWISSLDAEGVRTVELGVVALGRPALDGARSPRFVAMERRGTTTAATVETILGGASAVSPRDRGDRVAATAR